ncbi:uncharacterized protein LOC141529430 [Cotesia typhae]|uniref:uncharacterized protein LOC141529430 n=1 Tax=Cotesia typhae TaxID=2053667 RepID=UPI003D687BDC
MEDVDLQIEENFSELSSLNNSLCLEDFMILHLNVRGLNTNFETLELFIEELRIKPDIIVCSETWSLPCYTFFMIKDYDCYYNHSKINKADGVVMYIKKSLNSSVVIDVVGNLKIISASVKLKNNNVIKVSSFYRCHDVSEEVFIDTMLRFLDDTSHGVNHAIIGDFNINLLNLDKSSNDFLPNFLGYGYIPYCNGITRPNAFGGSCIDNCYVKSNISQIKSFTYTNVFTDHYPIFIRFGSRPNDKSTQKNTFLDYNRLSHLSKSYDWSIFQNIHDPNEFFALFFSIIKTFITDSNFKVKHSSRLNKPRSSWITKGIMISCKTKETLYNIWKLDKNNLTLKNEYNTYCKTLNKIVKAAKAKYEKNKVDKYINDSKKMWQFVNSKLGKNIKSSNNIDYIVCNERIIEDSKIIADNFVEYFSNVGVELANKINTKSINANNFVKHNSKSLFLLPTDSFEIKKTILNLKNKSGGVDGINSKILKILVNEIALPLANIFNKCISLAIWPDALKKADIIPLFKNGNKHLTTNYRPISLISNLAKIFEKIIYTRLYEFSIRNHLISDNQFGFIKGRGTGDALALTSNYIYNNIDSNKPTVIAFLDLAKAFDTVNHELLLEKLWRKGIRGLPHELIKNYLADRQQCVKQDIQRDRQRDIKQDIQWDRQRDSKQDIQWDHQRDIKQDPQHDIQPARYPARYPVRPSARFQARYPVRPSARYPARYLARYPVRPSARYRARPSA